MKAQKKREFQNKDSEEREKETTVTEIEDDPIEM